MSINRGNRFMAFLALLGILAGVCAVVVVGDAVKAWAPRQQAKAQIELAQAEAQALRGRETWEATRETAWQVIRFLLWVVAILSTAAAFALGVYALSVAIRKARAAVQLAPWQELPQRPIQFPGLAYDPRHGAVDALGAAHAGDLDRLRALNDGDAQRINAAGLALTGATIPITHRQLTGEKVIDL